MFAHVQLHSVIQDLKITNKISRIFKRKPLRHHTCVIISIWAGITAIITFNQIQFSIFYPVKVNNVIL